MKLRSWGAAALAACALVASAANVQAKSPAPKKAAKAPSSILQDQDQIELAGYNSLGSCSTGECSSGSCSCGSCSGGGGGGAMGGLMDRPMQLIFGAEYIYARANFSDALAFVEQNLVDGGETWHCFDFDYGSSYSFYGGVYLPDCGGSLIFDYTRLQSEAFTSAQSSSTVNIFGPFEIDDNIEGFADVDLQTYDVMFAKTIPLGCPLDCGCGPDCGDCCDTCTTTGCGSGCGCGCGWCPAWDITWSGGVRFADIDWSRGLDAFDANNLPVDGYRTDMTFQGFGGRVGLLGRRYIGRRGLASLYAKGDWSLLIGDVDLRTNVFDADVGPAPVAFSHKSCEQVIPVSEIELGGSIHLGAHATLSGGYFWSAWHDLGTSETYGFNNFQVSHYDDGNILGFDGLFARAEVAF
jgi:hypothetical protein